MDQPSGLVREITDDEIDGYHRDGAVLLKGVIGPDWIEVLAAGLEHANNHPDGMSAGVAEPLPMPTITGTLSQPIKTILQIFQVHMALGFAPMLLSVTSDIFQVIFCPPCDSVFCHQASLSRSLISASIEKSLTKSPVSACFAPSAK